MNRMLVGLYLIWTSVLVGNAQFSLRSGKPVTVSIAKTEAEVVNTALSLFARDYKVVFSDTVEIVDATKEGQIVVGTLGKSPLTGDDVYLQSLKGKKQTFLIRVLPDGRLLIVGSDSHGTAYGIMQLSRLIGVSPWEWWADATPTKLKDFKLPKNYSELQSPSVEYRGIFINDEDWGLMPWSCNNYDKQPYGTIGPRTNERIFELMLRLRANTYWPAMHECTHPFFLTDGNREMAKKFGIYIGGSHCEPMATSPAGEWPIRGKGDYNYVNNRHAVYRFWEDRVKDVDNQEIIYTLGMRGLHDGHMQGGKTIDRQKDVLGKVISDQRWMLRKYVNSDITKVPQLFIPYKEVLDVYRAGLQVPEDAILVWCDDNYGYVRHLPTVEEWSHSGGNGIYYHVSYWGRPHDYLWLGSFSPALLYQQMKTAYDGGIDRFWILNVGDIKPAEYQIELFMDMAWDIRSVEKEGITRHLCRFLQREFGKKMGEKLLPIMDEHYRLAYIRKPEFMGNTRTEEYGTDKYNKVRDLPWSEAYLTERLKDYTRISDKVETLSHHISPAKQDEFFQLVKYPVQGAAEMNKKMIYAQLARHGKESWEKSDAACDSIIALTATYNQGILNKGKWNGIMDYRPRKLVVFDKVARTTATEPFVAERKPLHKWNAIEAKEGNFAPCENLGYEKGAAAISKNGRIVFEFSKCQADSIDVEVTLLPNHPATGTELRFALVLDGIEYPSIDYATKGRSEEWKENVLRNQAIRKITRPLD